MPTGSTPNATQQAADLAAADAAIAAAQVRAARSEFAGARGTAASAALTTAAAGTPAVRLACAAALARAQDECAQLDLVAATRSSQAATQHALDQGKRASADAAVYHVLFEQGSGAAGRLALNATRLARVADPT